jgi:hypothetical protein
VFAFGTDMSYYRFSLPLPLAGKPAQSGTWHAVLQVEEKIFGRLAHGKDQSAGAFAARMAHGVRYSLNTHALSNLRMQARLSQTGQEPGATMMLSAALTEYGIPVEHRANVTAVLQRPDGTPATLTLAEYAPGVFQASLPAPQQGVYRFRVVAAGITMRGKAFTREQLVSGAVVQGGNNPFPTTDPSTKDHDEALCGLLRCLLGSDALGRWLSEQHIDPNGLQKCVDTWCRATLAPPSVEELRRREGI